MTPRTILILVCLAAVAAPLPAADTPPLFRDRVLMVLADDFMVTEFWGPYYALRAGGYTVDVASFAEGPVRTGNSDDNAATANLTLDNVDPRNYVGLVIPGGLSPQKLEQSPRALEICRAFMTADRVTAGICHGPRLLAQAGVLKGRVFTCLWQVADELPDLWASEAFGTFVDRPVVVDRNLVTSRWPPDIDPFSRATLQALSKHGGLALPAQTARVALVHADASRQTLWAFTYGLRALGHTVDTFRCGQLDKADKLTPDHYDLLVVLDGKDYDRYRKDDRFAAVVTAFRDAGTDAPRVAAVGEAYLLLGERKLQGQTVRQVEGDPASAVAAVAPLAAAVGREPEVTAPAPAPAALAVTPGFDDAVVAALAAALKQRGLDVLYVAPQAGWVRGVNGTAVLATATYADASVAPAAVVVAPGYFWAKRDSDAARKAWLLARYDAGATLVVFGFDSLLLGPDERFAGKRFSGSDPAGWFYGKTGGGPTDAPATQTDERVISGKDSDAVPAVLDLLDEQRPTPQAQPQARAPGVS